MIYELAGTADAPNADLESKVSDEMELTKDKGSKITDLLQNGSFLRIG